MNRAQWNALADNFEREVCDITREELSGRLIRAYVNAIQLPKQATLVDLGCGIGTFIRDFHDLFSLAIGAEFAPRIIARAKQRCAQAKNVSWLTMDIARASLKTGTIADLAVCMNVITSPNAATRKAQWDAIARVTKAGGFALVVIPSLESDVMVEEAMAGGKRRQPAPEGLVQRGKDFQKHYTRSELRTIFAKHGFLVQHIRRAYYPWQKEGIKRPQSAKAKAPWDWACLATRN